MWGCKIGCTLLHTLVQAAHALFLLAGIEQSGRQSGRNSFRQTWG